MTDRSTTRPQLRRGLGVALSGLLLAGTLVVPAAALASGGPPTAVADTISGTEDQNVVVDASVLLANDTDEEGDTLTVTQVENPLEGTVVLVGTTITFTPLANDCGADTASFTYEITDGSNGPAHALVHVDLTCVNDAPVAHNDTEAGHQDDPLVMTDHDLVANDDDIDTDNNDLFIAGASTPTHGTLNYNSTTHDVTFTPTAGQCNPTEGGFTYTVSDGDKTDTANVTVTLTCNGTNHDPIATNDVRAGTEDTQLLITGASLVSNDTDADGDTLTVASTKSPVGGTVSLAAGTVTFTPTANLCGANVAGFDYDVFDGTDGDDFGHVTISLACVNDAPVTHADHAIVAQNSGQADYNVLANDTDPEGDPITLVNATGNPSIGTVSVVAGKVRYTPAAGFHGEAVITYTASDGSLQSPGTLTVTVGADDFPPIVSGPTVAFGTGKVDDSAPLRISWNAIDNGAGVQGFKAQARIGDGKWKTISEGKATNVTKSFPFGKDLRFRVRATDKAGNRSAWKTSDARRIVDTTHKSSNVKYTGKWTRVTGDHQYAYTAKRDNSARLSTTGRQVLYVAPKTSASGFVQVFVDGNLVGRFDLHSNKAKYDRIIAKATLAGGPTHVIRIVNDSGNGKRTNLSDFVVLK